MVHLCHAGSRRENDKHNEEGMSHENLTIVAERRIYQGTRMWSGSQERERGAAQQRDGLKRP
jgi:hypothetical protein